MAGDPHPISAIGALTTSGLVEAEFSILDDIHKDGSSLDDWQLDLMKAAWETYGDEDDDAMESFMDETWTMNQDDYHAYLQTWDALPLHMAAGRGDIDMLNDLLAEKEYDVNLADADGNTPLHLAAWDDHGECAEALLAAGAQVNAINTTGQAPLHLAKSDTVAMPLLNAGADHQLQDKFGNSALDTSNKELSSACRRYLLEKVAAASRTEEDLATPEQALAARQAKYGRAM